MKYFYYNYRSNYQRGRRDRKQRDYN